MIKIDKGNLTMYGSTSDLLTDTTFILEHVRNTLVDSGMEEAVADEMIDAAVELSRLQGDDLKECEKQLAAELASKIFGGIANDGSVEKNLKFNKTFGGK